MNSNVWKIGIAVLVVLTALILPVSASDTVIINSGLTSSFSITVAPGIMTFPLTVVGENLKLDGNLITVNTNGPFAIKMRDAMVTGSPVGSEGRMKAYDGSSTYTGGFLTNALETKLNGGSFIPLTGADQTIHAGSAGSFSAPIQLRQITTFADPPRTLPAGYQIGILITGSSV